MSTAFYTFAACYVGWVLYVTIMALKRARDAGTLSPAAKALGMPLLWAGLALDVVLNVTVCTALFLELPRELLITQRLIRLKQGEGWRARVAAWMCANLLDAFDPSGCHCE